ncbi:hypothetical protein D3C80_763790 [compost metagenome]
MCPKLPVGHTWDMLACPLHALDDLLFARGPQVLSVCQLIPFALPANPAWRRSEITRLRQLKMKLHARLVCELLEVTEAPVVATH